MTVSYPDAARHEFAGALQSALTVEEVGRAFLSASGRVLPACAVGLYRLDVDSGDVIEVHSDAEGLFLEEYERYGRADDPVLDFVLQQRRPIDSTRAAGGKKWEASGARAALGGAGLEHSLEAPLVVSGMLLGTVNFARAAKEPAFSHDDLLSARLVSEQVGLAMERALRFELTGQRSSMMESVLDRVPQAVIVTDLDAQVIFRNRAARNDLEPSGPAGVGTQATSAVEKAIVEAMAEFRVDGKRVHIQSFRDHKTSARRILKSYRLGRTQGAAVNLVFECGDQHDVQQLPVWQVLSKREQEIAQFVSEGLTTKQIADRAYISENTVKQHLKRVFAKTDVRNRAELVQLIWASGRQSSTPPSGA
ncbi:LuxR C-terminal-related transcriptional regulator [Nocardioides sp. GXZ039]|uniref:LuxR C-terminal-related transcriptional regulator n=1 Tax=Nocardioides sp. GXZ039 TaxID=3136018 RepID=UPI0030F4A7BF